MAIFCLMRIETKMFANRLWHVNSSNDIYTRIRTIISRFITIDLQLARGFIAASKLTVIAYLALWYSLADLSKR